MSGTAIEIYLKTIATGDGAKRLTAELNAVNAAADKAAVAQSKVTGSSRNMGNALLQGSRAIQDMQYGLAGAVNNLEGIASALGLGAGVAGVVTVLAVVLQQVGPKLAEFFSQFDTDKINTEGLKAFQAQLGMLGPGKDRAAIAGKKLEDQIRAEDLKLKAETETIKQQLALFNLRNAAAKGAAEFETQQKIEDIKAQNLPKEQEAAAIAQAKLELLKQQAELQQQAADAAVKAAQEEAGAAAKAAADAEARAARLEEIVTRTARLNDLIAQGAALRQKADELSADAQASTGNAFIPADVRQQMQVEAATAQQAAAANRAAQAAASMGPLADASTPALAEKARAEAVAKATAAAEAGRAVASTAQTTGTQYEIAALQREQERRRITREAAPGVYDQRNVINLPGGLGQPAPLPGAGSFAPGQLPPNPLGMPQALPSASNNAPPPGLGQPAALPGSDAVAKALKEAADAQAKRDAEILAVAKRMTANADKQREQLKNMRS